MSGREGKHRFLEVVTTLGQLKIQQDRFMVPMIMVTEIKNKIGYFVFCAVMQTVIQFSSVAQSCQTLCDPMKPSTPGIPVQHQLSEFNQTHVH